MKNLKAVIIGIAEDNTRIDGEVSFEKVKELIEDYRPIFVLSEKMENQGMETEHSFFQLMKKKKFSNMTSMDEVKELIKLCHRKNIKLVGMDFENFLMDMKQQTYVKKQRGGDEKMDEELESLAKRRENKHVKMIRKYIKISRKPVIAIVGAWHVREDSLIREAFKENPHGEIKLVYPVNEKGEQVIGPSKGKFRWKEEDL